MKRFFLPACASMLFVLAPAAAQQNSTTPYELLYQVLEPAQRIARYDRLSAIERIESKQPGVRPSDIRLTIRAARGDIAVPISADGRVDFPFDAALKSENPMVHSNQPKGTLLLTVTFELKIADPQRVAWSEMSAAMDQARAMFSEQTNGTPPPRVVGAEYRFARGTEASVTVSGRSERLLMSDDAGRVIVMFDDALLKEQPTITASKRPISIAPFLQP